MKNQNQEEIQLKYTTNITENRSRNTVERPEMTKDIISYVCCIFVL